MTKEAAAIALRDEEIQAMGAALTDRDEGLAKYEAEIARLREKLSSCESRQSKPSGKDYAVLKGIR